MADDMGSSEGFATSLPVASTISEPTSSNITSFEHHNQSWDLPHHNSFQDPNQSLVLPDHGQFSSQTSTYIASLFCSSPAPYPYNPRWNNSSALCFGPFAFSPSVESTHSWRSSAVATAKDYYTSKGINTEYGSTAASFGTYGLPAYPGLNTELVAASTPLRSVHSIKNYINRYMNALGSPSTSTERSHASSNQMQHRHSPSRADKKRYHYHSPARRLAVIDSVPEHPSCEGLLGHVDSFKSFLKGVPRPHSASNLDTIDQCETEDEQKEVSTQSHMPEIEFGYGGVGPSGDPPINEYNGEEHKPNQNCKKNPYGITSKDYGTTRIDSASYFSMLKYADKWDKLFIALGALGALMNGASLPIFSLLFGELVERLGTDKGFQSLRQVCLWMATLAVFTLFSSYAEVFALACSAERQALKIRTEALRALLRQGVGFFDISMETGVGLWYRISADVDCIQDAIGPKTASFLHYFATFLVGYIVGFAKSWQISLIVFFCSLSMLALGVLHHGFQEKLAAEEEETSTKATQLAHQAMTHIRTVFSNVAEEHVLGKYTELLKMSIPIATKIGFSKGAGVATFYFLTYLTWALVLWYGSVLIAENNVKGGNAVTCFLATIIGGRCLGLALQYFSSLTYGRCAASRVYQMVDRVPPIDVYSLDGMVLEDFKGRIEIKDVLFAYPARPELTVLHKVQLSVEPGSVVALVGPSGGGKSTLLSLLQRFYDPDKGSIHFDNVNIKHLHLQWMRQKIAHVPQEPVLFATTIRNNISYGQQDATDEDIKAAAELAGVHNFITSLHHGYDTQVDKFGITLSRGQKYKIAMARALLKEPTILLLQDALENDIESKAPESWTAMTSARSQTTIMEAHYVSRIRHASLIAVVQEGRIVEQGTHDILLANPIGVYSSLFLANKATHDVASPLVTHHSDSPTSGTPPSVSSSTLLSPYFSAETTPALFQPMDGTSLPPSSQLNYFPYKNTERNVPLSRIIQLSRPHLILLILGLLGAVHAGVTLPAYAYMIGITIGNYYHKSSQKMREEANAASLIIVLVGFSCFVAMVFQYGFCNWAGIKLTRVLRERIFAAILRKDMDWFERKENASRTLATQMFLASSRVRGLLGDRYSVLFMGVASVATTLTICLCVNWKLAMLATALTPILLSANYMETLLAHVGSQDWEVDAVDESHNIASEAIANIRTLAAYGAEASSISSFIAAGSASIKPFMRHAQLSGAALGMAEASAFGSYAVLFYYSSVMVSEQHKADFRNVVRVLIVLILSFFSVGSLPRLLPDYKKASAAARSIFHIMDDESKMRNQAGHRLDEVAGDLQFLKVTFAYPLEPKREILTNFNLKVKARNTMALVGAHASGKSTILSLVQRLYDTLQGQIFLDGVDIRDLELAWLRNQMALVSQEPVLFECSIWENIAWGNPNASMAEIEQAAQVANAHDFISSLEKGYATQVGNGKLRLTATQMQRIAIARAALRKPKVLLVDESTGMLDIQSERIMQKILQRIMDHCTTIIAVRRLLTARYPKHIALIEGGRVVELGTHEKLMKKREGSYYAMVKAQTQQHSECKGLLSLALE